MNDIQFLNGETRIEIWNLGDDQLILNYSIYFFLTVDGDEMSGYYKPLGIYSLSETFREIEEEIKRDIANLYKEFIGIPDAQLGEDPKMWKAHLNEIISIKPN